MKKEPKLIAKPWFDAPEIFAEYLWRTDLVTPIVECIGGALIAAPLMLARWLAPEVRTPENSPAPRILPAEAGRFSGVILVHRNEAKAWAMTKVADGDVTYPANRSQVLHPDPRNVIHHDERFGQPPGLWPEDEQYDPYRHDRWGGV